MKPKERMEIVAAGEEEGKSEMSCGACYRAGCESRRDEDIKFKRGIFL